MNTIRAGKYEAWVDDVDFIWASNLTWSFTKIGHKVRGLWRPPKIGGVRAPTHQMSRMIGERMFGPLPMHIVIDHRNGVTLDNRRGNLRLATFTLNSLNRVVSCTKKTGLPLGVTFQPFKSPYLARIMVSGRSRYLGSYSTIAEAKQAYDDALARYIKVEEQTAVDEVQRFQRGLKTLADCVQARH